MNVHENAGLVLLTTSEAADYLRIRERKLYELVAEGAIPCTKVTGKWLFPRGDLDRWLLAGMARPHGVIPADPPPIIGGSHDPLLQWALAECRAGIAILPEGSKTGYRRFLKGELLAAAVHFHSREAPEADANVDIVSREPGLYDAVLIGFATRQQGLVVARGNPMALGSLAEAVRKKARLAARPPGAGAQQLLQMLMARDGIGDESLPAALTAPTGPDIAQAIRAGHADFGIATTAIATAAGLDFVPLVDERFDLVMRQRDSYRGPLAKFLELVRSPSFKAQAAELGGFDVTDAGKVRWAP
jgi:excisionase family DNA binding protein